MSAPILEIENVNKHYPIKEGFFNRQVGLKQVVNCINFKIEDGETVALVGESGCGKSVLLRTIIGLEPPTDGNVVYRQKNVYEMDKRGKKEFRKKVQLIFQNAFTALHPRFTIEQSLEEVLLLTGMKDRKKRKQVIIDTLKKVGLDPIYRFRFPEQLSGGQCQRVIIARALVEQPDLILADEPISSLDVSLQAQVLNLLMDLQDEFKMSMLFVAHDLAVVRQMASKIMIMYAGTILESGPSSEIYNNAQHPYTKVLLKSAPSISKGINEEGFNLDIKVGDTPNPDSLPVGCLFNTRCMYSEERCFLERPLAIEVAPEHFVSCFLATPTHQEYHPL
jgi:oligopeptide/dipeptide ABC transporter ATP-binding protein